jgi:hypothetical protein
VNGPDPFLFIVGCGRSGTTLVRAMLDSHPDLAVAHESFFVPWVAHRRPLYESGAQFDSRRFICDLLHAYDFSKWLLSSEEVEAALVNGHIRSVAEGVRRVFELYARKQGKRRYADKSPRYALHMGRIVDLLPEACFLHVIRDGRNVALSLIEQPFGPNSLGGCSIHWRDHVQHARAAGKALGKARYQELKYEDLIDEPEACLSRLCDFIGLRFDEEMLHYFERADSVIATTGQQGHHRSLFLPPTKSIRSWQDSMSGPQVGVFESSAGDLLKSLGYELVAGPPSLSRRLRAECHELGAKMRSARLRIRILLRKLRVARVVKR